MQQEWEGKHDGEGSVGGAGGRDRDGVLGRIPSE